jgi:hypothetical protein
MLIMQPLLSNCPEHAKKKFEGSVNDASLQNIQKMNFAFPFPPFPPPPPLPPPDLL